MTYNYVYHCNLKCLLRTLIAIVTDSRRQMDTNGVSTFHICNNKTSHRQMPRLYARLSSLLSRCSSWKCHVLLAQSSLLSCSLWACSPYCSERQMMYYRACNLFLTPTELEVSECGVDRGLGSRTFTRFQ